MCTSQDCSSSNLSATIADPDGHQTGRPFLAIGNDSLPIFSYRDTTDGDLKVVHCDSSDCGSGTLTSTVDASPNHVGGTSSIAIGNDSLPIISYYDISAGDLKVAHCNDIACSGPATINTVDSGDVGWWTSISIGPGKLPTISYREGVVGALKVATCENASCTGSALLATVDDPANDVGSHSSLAIAPDGLPIVAYYDETDKALKIAKCGTRTCL